MSLVTLGIIIYILDTIEMVWLCSGNVLIIW